MKLRKNSHVIAIGLVIAVVLFLFLADWCLGCSVGKKWSVNQDPHYNVTYWYGIDGTTCGGIAPSSDGRWIAGTADRKPSEIYATEGAAVNHVEESCK